MRVMSPKEEFVLFELRLFERERVESFFFFFFFIYYLFIVLFVLFVY